MADEEQARTFATRYLGARDNLSFEASLAYLRQAEGSNRGAARRAGYAESTLRGWSTGRRNPTAAAIKRIQEVVRDLRTPPAKAEPEFRMFNNDRRRTKGKHPRKPVPAEKMQLAPGLMAKARAVYVATGDAGAAYTTFVKGIGNDFYRGSLANSGDIRLDDDDESMYEGLSSDYGMTLI